MTCSTNYQLPSNIYFPHTLESLLFDLNKYIDDDIDTARQEYIRANLWAMADDAEPVTAHHKRRLDWLLAKKNEIALAQHRLNLEFKLDELEDEMAVSKAETVAASTPLHEETPLF